MLTAFDRLLIQIFTMLSLFLLLLVQSTTSILIGSMSNVSYQSNDTISVTFNGTCTQCLCEAFVSNPSPNYVAFNCYANENKCDLFHNYSISYQLVTNTSSQFYFYPNLPPLVTFSTSEFRYPKWELWLWILLFSASVTTDPILLTTTSLPTTCKYINLHFMEEKQTVDLSYYLWKYI